MNRSAQFSPRKYEVGVYPIVLVAVSLTAIVASFILANSVSDYAARSIGFSAVIVGYLSICLVIYVLDRLGSGGFGAMSRPRIGDADIDESLYAIEEASEYFGGSLKSADMFRLLSNKVDQILPVTASVLFVVDGAAEKLKVVQAQGEHAEKLRDIETGFESGLAGHARTTGTVQVGRGTLASELSFSADVLKSFRSSAAIPLKRSGEVFAVLQFYSDSRTAFDGDSISILEAIGERVTPLISSSLSFERSLLNALTDPITALPNERAFHLVLENQIAEAQRNRDERPLTIIAIDIKGFDELNRKYGHATGDRILSSTADAIKVQLRQMDLVARASNDEFLVILPTANEEIAGEVIARIDTGLFGSRFYVDDTESIRPELSFGVATFGKHGETAEALVGAARLRKQQTKTEAPPKVAWLSERFVN